MPRWGVWGSSFVRVEDGGFVGVAEAFGPDAGGGDAVLVEEGDLGFVEARGFAGVGEVDGVGHEFGGGLGEGCGGAVAREAEVSGEVAAHGADGETVDG